MNGIRIFTSNRMEVLADRLALHLRSPLAEPLAPEVVVVQSRGMERWVSMALARRNGVCANLRFPFPNAFFGEVLFGEAEPRAAFGEKGVLAFRIMKHLRRSLNRPDFAEISLYLADDPFQRKRYQLAAVLADLFDQYAVFRPDMLMRWEQGRVEPDRSHRWQARLWSELAAEDPALNRVTQWENRLREMRAGAEAGDGRRRLPERVSLFGISYLPPLYLRGFEALSRFMPVDFFLLNPCREYWADLVSERRIETADPHRELHLEIGHPLLASLGGLGRDFFRQLAGFEAVHEESFEAPPADTVLGRLQRDVLELRDPGESAAEPLQAGDDSIQIHAVHSPMREMEVLHDQLLDFFEKDPGLRPRDIVVMAPDIGFYAPYIEAVFGAPAQEGTAIPFTIADRGPAGGGELQAALAALLDLKGSRLGAAEVLKLLEYPAVRNRFGIAEGDLPLIEGWVRDTGIRWGRDAAGRAAAGLPAVAQNTWQAGIDRLLLGYAMPAGGRGLFQGILPYDNVEGAETRMLGGFIEFLSRVFQLAADLETPRELGEWGARLAALPAEFLEPEPGREEESRLLLALFNALAEHQERAGFDEAVPLEVVRGFLEDRLEAERIGYGFLSGGVTFCAMLPMRSIPFHTVCLVGMNHDAFPREHHPPAFDLMSRQPRRGDRSRRNDDKYLFLEALLSARRRFYVSYIGQGIQDNRPQPPSVLVGELLDALERNYGGSGGPSGGGWTTRHRLQAFSEAYFDGSCGLFSYSREDLDGCRAGREGSPGGAFFRGPIEMPPEEAPGWREVSPERLRAFFAHPVRFLVQGRLDLRLEEAPGSPDAREPFALDPLSRYRLAQAFLGALRDGENPRSLLPFFRAAGELPHGAAGDLVFDRLRQEVELFFKGIEGFLPSAHGAEISVGARLGDFRLNAVLRHLSVEGDLSVRYAAAAAKDFLGAWIRHLFLCIGAEGRLPCRSLMVAKGSAWSFAPVADGRRVLGELLALYARGLTEPLPFFPETSLEYFRRQSRPAADPEAALALARRKWEGSEEAPGDSADPYHRLCFGEADPLGDAFKRISVAVFGPLFDHCRQLTPAG